MGAERRTAPRVEISTAVKVETARGIQRYKSLNLSTGGIFLESEKPLAVGTDLILKFDLPGSGAVQAKGVVKHHHPLLIFVEGVGQKVLQGMGIAFVRIEGEGSQDLAEKIKKLSLQTH